MSRAVAALVLLFCWPALADEPDPALLTLDRLHGSEEFRSEGAPALRWLADGSGYTVLEAAEGGGRAIVRHDPANGERTVLVSASQLIPEGRERPLGVSDYRWSEDGRKVLVFTNTRRVWRANTRGDYWVLDRDSGSLRRLGAEYDEATLMFAKFSPRGDRVAYVQAHDIVVEELASGTTTRLTSGGGETLIHGTFDWVYEEEWGLRDGFRWSPDGERIAFWQIDTSGVRRFTLVDNTRGLYPELQSFPYPKVGEQNPACRVGVVPSRGGEIRWLDVPGDRRDHYIARMEWAASPDEIILQQLNRLQNTNRVMLADAANGAVRTVFVDRDETWVEVEDQLHWLEGGARFLFVSERDGWRHVYSVARDGGDVRLLTPGDYDVVGVVHVDEPGDRLYVIAAPGQPTRRFLHRVPLSSGGPPVRVTPAEVGTHSYRVSADGRFALHTASSFGVPPTVELVTLPDHEVLRTFTDNATLRARLDGLARGRSGFLRLVIDDFGDGRQRNGVDDGIEVDAWFIEPPDLDPAKRYPLLVHVYGEPAGQTVVDRWGGGNYLWHLMLAQRGAIVVSFDNRGTPAPRGRAWRKSVYRQIGILAADDQAAALRVLEERWPHVDRSRVGIWGWSGGGSMSLNAIFRYPELYQTAIAIAFVANQRFYDTIYQERYMGLPDDNEAGFRDGSPITHAHRLQGNLLLVYGTGDDNCHYQNCEALVNELIRHGKRFSMMAYPNRSHGIHEGPGTRRHLFELMTRFLDANLPLGARDPSVRRASL